MSSAPLTIVDSQPLPQQAAAPLTITDSQPLPGSASQSAPQSWWQRLVASMGAPEDTRVSMPARGDAQSGANAFNNSVQQQGQYMRDAFGKAVPIAATAMAPELAPEAGLLLRAGLTAAGAEVGTSTSQAIQGQNPLAKQQLEEAGTNAALAGASDLTIGALAKGWGSKLSRGMINESAGATARDVTYGNPAKALLNELPSNPSNPFEGTGNPFTGDLEKYKAALRSGATQTQAYQAAGGRIAAVASKVDALAPQLNAMLSKSTVQIPVADVIDKPLMDAATEIINNRAMTQAEKDAAIGQLGAFQHSLKEGLGNTISPLQANQIKQSIGDRVNWAGNIAVTDEVKPAYRTVYGTLKQAVNSAVPGSAALNERLTDLLAAQTDLHKLMQAEEVGQGKGALGSAVTGIARRAEAVAGRGIPAAAQFTAGARAVAPPGLVGLNQLMGVQQ